MARVALQDGEIHEEVPDCWSLSQYKAYRG
jgi:hypothetical protein